MKLKQLLSNVQKMIAEYGEDAPVASFIYLPSDIYAATGYLLDDDTTAAILDAFSRKGGVNEELWEHLVTATESATQEQNNA